MLEQENQKSVVKYQVAAKLLECSAIDSSREPLQSLCSATDPLGRELNPKQTAIRFISNTRANYKLVTSGEHMSR